MFEAIAQITKIWPAQEKLFDSPAETYPNECETQTKKIQNEPTRR